MIAINTTKIIEENLPDLISVHTEVPFYEMDQFDWRFLKGRPPLTIRHTLVGTSAATAGNYGVFFIAQFNCEVLSVREAHETAGTDAGAVTLDIEKLTGTQALDGGVAVLNATIDLKGTVNTVVTPALTATRANRLLAVGNRLALKDSGTLTAVAGMTITIEIAPAYTTIERK